MTSANQATLAPARFEAIEVGMTLPPLERGQLTTIHLMRWSAAIENWHRIHYDEPFARGHDGLPGLLVSGSWKQHFAVDLLWRWVRPNGWVASVELRFSRPNFVGDTLTATGVVSAVETRDNLGFVHCDLLIVNHNGEENTSGRALCVLPLDGGRVPYPYSSPAAP
jgi:acyl dehydratase